MNPLLSQVIQNVNICVPLAGFELMTLRLRILHLTSTTVGSVAEWFVRWTTKLATRVRPRVAAGLPTGYSMLGGNLTGNCFQQNRPRLDNRGGNYTHRGLFWK